MTKVIAIASPTGGVGKTRTASHLGVGLAKCGQRVLLIDLDAQANLTMSLGWTEPDTLPTTIATLLDKTAREEPLPFHEGILHSAEGVDLLPSSIQLSGYEATLVSEFGRESVLRQYLQGIRQDYDFLLIDCMPSLNILTVNALTAADSVLIPTQPQYFSAAGLQMLFQTIHRVQRKLNPPLKIEGVLVTMMDRRPLFARELVEKLRENYGEQIPVFEAEIPSSIRVTESSARGQSLFSYDPRGGVALADDARAKEGLDHARPRIREGRAFPASGRTL